MPVAAGATGRRSGDRAALELAAGWAFCEQPTAHKAVAARRVSNEATIIHLVLSSGSPCGIYWFLPITKPSLLPPLLPGEGVAGEVPQAELRLQLCKPQ